MKYLKAVFFILVCVSVTAAFWVFKDLLFPFVTSKAFFFRITVELALPLYAYFLVVDKRLRPNLKNPLNILILSFVILNFISAFSGVNLTRSLWGNFERMGGAYYTAHLAILYFYILCLGQMGNWYLQWFLKVLLLVALVVTVNGISGWLGGPNLVTDPTLPTRISSTLGNPIYVGSFLIIPVFLCLFFAHQSHNRFKLTLYYFLAFLCLVGIYLSGTRGAVMGLLGGSFLGSLVFLFFNSSKKVKIYGLAIVGFFVAVGVLLFVYHNKLPQGSNVRRIFNLTDSNTYSRLLQWQVALKGFKDRPLLGTGPENYYVVANLYYNPQIAEYDASWFDKPHNYILEILVTDGILGFLAYVGILIYFLFALYKGFKAGLYGLLEFSFLVAALAAYQIQNLFVFDTVPASLMFFAFAGFAGYIYYLSENPEDNTKKKILTSTDKAFAVAIFALSFCLMLYAEYATNYIPLRVAKSVNYGFAYSSIDLNKAVDYFRTAMSLPYNFDETETASKFSDFGTGVIRSSSGQNQTQALEILKESTEYLAAVTEKQPDNPILWERLALAYLFQSRQVGDKVIVDLRAKDSIEKALELAPTRNEAYLSLAQFRALEGNFDEAEKILLQAKQNIPSDRSARLQLVNLYRAFGKLDQAAAEINELIEMGHKFSSYADMKWLIDYYTIQKDYEKAIALQQKATEIEPSNIQVFVDLAKLYNLADRKDEARNLAENIIKFDKSKSEELRGLLSPAPLRPVASSTAK